MTKETKEEFVARYPKPGPRRILVKCECDDDICTGWAWSFIDYISPQETPVEEPENA